MAAFVVVAPGIPSSAPQTGERLNIFPGAATPTVFAADAPFWVGYGFVPEGGRSADQNEAELGPDTRFELVVDGQSIPLLTDVTIEEGQAVGKLSAASFPTGLPVGWHRFAGRWYVAGRLVLSSDVSIEFVER